MQHFKLQDRAERSGPLHVHCMNLSGIQGGRKLPYWIRDECGREIRRPSITLRLLLHRLL